MGMVMRCRNTAGRDPDLSLAIFSQRWIASLLRDAGPRARGVGRVEAVVGGEDVPLEFQTFLSSGFCPAQTWAHKCLQAGLAVAALDVDRLAAPH